MKNKTLVFEAGAQHDNVYTNEDVKSIAENYEESNYSAPWVLGHETKSGDPAAGWVRGLEYKEENGVGQLWAISDFNPLGESAINDGTYENKSVSFYKPDSPFNPTPGQWALRHIALLGAEPPALKNLGPVAVINYSEEEQAEDYSSYSCSCQQSKKLMEDEKIIENSDLSAIKQELEELKTQLEEALKQAADARMELSASKEANTALTVSSSVAPYYSEGCITEDVLPEAVLTSVLTKLTLGLTNYSDEETPLSVIEALLSLLKPASEEPEYGETWPEKQDHKAPQKVEYADGDELDDLARKTAAQYGLSYGQALSAVVSAQEISSTKAVNFSESLAEAVKQYKK